MFNLKPRSWLKRGFLTNKMSHEFLLLLVNCFNSGEKGKKMSPTPLFDLSTSKHSNMFYKEIL